MISRMSQLICGTVTTLGGANAQFGTLTVPQRGRNLVDFLPVTLENLSMSSLGRPRTERSGLLILKSERYSGSITGILHHRLVMGI